MAEAHPGAQLHQIGRLGGCDRVHRNSELLGGARQQRHVAERIGCRGQQERLGVRGKLVNSPEESLLDLPRQSTAVRPPETAGQLFGGHIPGQFQQCQRVALRLGHDAVANAFIEEPWNDRVQQRAGVGRTQAAHGEFGQPGEFAIDAIAYREQHGDRFAAQTPGDKGQGLQGDPVKPLRVVDHAQHGLMLGGRCQQAQHRQSDQKAIGRGATTGSERDGECLTLRVGYRPGVLRQGRAELL
ncbi:Uncharacterised protein [Mycobacteroides abscessus subsp. massiliense]|nr:Uncharacterised protein [Mycobacteroides abscessus subsp. massiliense]SKS13680.1 Uncharacterised protein [Mycobacteroides abscessus subsp. massiliense]SKV70873.1 Uncharacterised protein [Mycobacteroides abscessus subsp. massiliense]